MKLVPPNFDSVNYGEPAINLDQFNEWARKVLQPILNKGEQDIKLFVEVPVKYYGQTLYKRLQGPDETPKTKT